MDLARPMKRRDPETLPLADPEKCVATLIWFCCSGHAESSSLEACSVVEMVSSISRVILVPLIVSGLSECVTAN
jgi:hypothetical protein